MEFADSLGYTETWVGEHFLLPWENMPSPEAVHSEGAWRYQAYVVRDGGVAERISTIRRTWRIASRSWTTWRAGRIFLGIGAGGSEVDSALFDIRHQQGRAPRAHGGVR